MKDQILPPDHIGATYLPMTFSEEEAASYLKISRITIQRIRLRGEITFARIGGTRVVYTSQHLEQYICSRERAAVAAS